jgi:hypothetical protein
MTALSFVLAVGGLVVGEPAPPPDYLQRAATLIDQGDDEGALPYLACYVRDHPEHLMARAYLAELFWRVHRPAEARRHFERFCADAQDQTGPVGDHLLHCHTRLAEIATERDDAFGQHLHRGIGLWLLARRAADLGADGSLSPEAVLCRAAGELGQALRARPGSARVNWYLFRVWTQLAQRQPAERCLRAARSAVLSDLTPGEQQALGLAEAVRLGR